MLFSGSGGSGAGLGRKRIGGTGTFTRRAAVPVPAVKPKAAPCLFPARFNILAFSPAKP
ncbi:hypothetical protein [[Bacillus] enclensis]|uniref:hypothetical protein n=1 Tax=[Bacillus] enclensis TaxID=1402860 RepID=UPI0012E3B27E|nr:hypothetical protein [[Bacillus] enclensis]